uniref:L27-1 domain-containing protein n=1 Tax=Laticauda laticaudata TaxID=8630 RepID=A0A8C5SQ47_LATLA
IPVRTWDTQRAVAILARYQGVLQSPAEQPLRASVEKVVRVFQSELFQALLGKGGWQRPSAQAMPLLGVTLGIGPLKPELLLGG